MMERQEFVGRTAAEAAIKACDEFGISRSQLKFEVVSDEGDGLERNVKIIATSTGGSISGPLQEQEMRESRPPKREGGGRARRDNQRSGGRGRSGRPGRGGSRSRRGGSNQNPGDGIESLLNLEVVPSERLENRSLFEGDRSEKASLALSTLTEMFGLAGLQLEPHLIEDNAEEIQIDLCGGDEAKIIGKRGEALLALQFILNRMVGRRADADAEVTAIVVLDAARYRERRRQALADLAKKLAARATEESKVVRLSPMSAHDRRVFHVTLKEMDGVDTRSEGDGIYRNLLIIPGDYE